MTSQDIVISPGAILLLNDGTGNFTFVDKGDTRKWTNHRHACFDADGRGGLDIWTASGSYDPILLLNEGTLVLEPHDGGDATNERGRSDHAEAFDANGDGYLDLYISTFEGKNKLLLNDGTGKFKSHSSQATERSGLSKHALAFDANGDGHPDLYVTNGAYNGFDANGGYNVAYSWQPNQYNELFLNDNEGKGNYVLVSKEDAGDVIGHDGPMSTASEGDVLQSDYAMAFDCDNDGDLDLLLVRQHPSEHSGLFLNDGSGSFAYSPNAVQELTGDGNTVHPKMAVALDADNDGDMDLFVVMHGGPTMFFLNNGQGVFASIDAGDATKDEWVYLGNQHMGNIMHGMHWEMAVVGDFNLDGFPDLYVVAHSSEQTYVEKNVLLLNEGSSSDGVSFVSADGGDLPTFVVDGPPREDLSFAAIDIDQDGDLDLIGLGHHSVAGYMVLFDSSALYVNDGSANFKRFDLGWFLMIKLNSKLLLAILTPMVIRISSLPHLEEGLTRSI